ncbi:hypothetical protein RhiirC2_777065, partial [Rhizophagus irregularis]
RKISSYFTDKPFNNHIHIVVKPPKLIHFNLELALKVGFLNEKGNVEYLGKDYIYKATLRENCLCTKDGKYHSFIEFIRLNNQCITYWEVHDKIYKFISYKNEDNLFIDHLSILWSDDFKKCLRQLYVKEDIVDIFWGQSLKDDDTTWCVYIVSRNICHLCKKTENVKEDQIIHFIAEEEGQRAGQSFRKIHYNLKGILHHGCDRFPNKICGYPVDVVKACTATLYVRTAGTLSAVVSDKHLEWIDLDDLKQSFGQIAAEAYREISEKMCHVIDGHRQNSALARYEHEIPPYSNNVSEGIFIRYMKTLLIQEMNEMHQQCYPTVWFDLQLVFAFEYGGFEPGDSGANLLWLKKEKLLVSFMRHG